MICVFQTGRIRWGNIPWTDKDTDKDNNDPNSTEIKNINNINDSSINKNIDNINKKKVLIKDVPEHLLWRPALSPNGKTYYWNVKTRKTQWEKPSTLIE